MVALLILSFINRKSVLSLTSKQLLPECSMPLFRCQSFALA